MSTAKLTSSLVLEHILHQLSRACGKKIVDNYLDFYGKEDVTAGGVLVCKDSMFIFNYTEVRRFVILFHPVINIK